MTNFDALLVLSFGGPEQRDDVIPFLENVLRGKNVPRERMLEVAEHYYHFDGVSPINQQNRELIAALENELSIHGPKLPIYWGNRNWHPYLPDTLRKMQADGRHRVLVFVTSSFSSYSGCRQYLEDIDRARASMGEQAPRLEKLRGFFNHPRFIAAVVDRVRSALSEVPANRRASTLLIFTAHSIPGAMAQGCAYEQQLNEACRLVFEQFRNQPELTISSSTSQMAENPIDVPVPEWRLAYQSRSGPPSQPWLEPDILQVIRDASSKGEYSHVVLIPIGFVSDHMEVLYDLDFEARSLCERQGLAYVRAQTVGTHPLFVSMIRELIIERVIDGPRHSIGSLPMRPDLCPNDCCPSGRRPMGT